MTLPNFRSTWLQTAGRLRRDEAGALTTFGLYICAAMAIVGGIAIDYQNLMTVRAQLQVTADAVAHAALYNRETMDPDDAKEAAIALVQSTQPNAKYGDVLLPDDIIFGTYDIADDKFYADPNGTEAVLVSTARLLERGNPVIGHLMQFVGFDTFDVRTNSIFVTYQPPCFREGFVAEDVVDIQSNNAFYNGFCIHSNTYVSVNSNNFFEPGSVVSMPDTTLLDLPNSGFETNEGLRQALRNGVYRLRLLNRINHEIDEIMTFGSERMPAYINGPLVHALHGKQIKASDLVQNAYNRITCNGNSITITPDVPLQNMVVHTPCEVTFGNGTVLDNTIFITTATHQDYAVKGSHIQVGRDDNCADDGGSIIISKGGMTFASNLKAYGAQLLALGNIEFAANADGIEGASFISGMTISGTSNMTMGFCGGGMDHTLQADYFRLAL